MKIHELNGRQLDWAVLTAEGYTNLRKGTFYTLLMKHPTRDKEIFIDNFKYHKNWALAGPIIEIEGIDTFCTLIGKPNHVDKAWQKSTWRARMTIQSPNQYPSDANTAIIAAMRCYVQYKLGDEITIPKELL